MNETYRTLDNIDTALSSLSILQQLASRIVFDVDACENNLEMTKVKLEEAWTLLDLLKEKTEVIRHDLQSVIKICAD